MVQRLIKAVVIALACTQAAWAVPVVTLTAPANNASYPSPASITLSAQASDTGDSIAKVEFYVSSALIGAATQTPYTVNWTNVASGSYTITAKATNSAGASTVSDPVTVNVTGAAAGAATGGGQAAPVYYIQPDHLNTPRVITDSNNNVVWRWDNAEPFGNNVANENPGGLGTFAYNLRFPGQYFDRETGLHQNYFRDYDPATGRYVQSDPIGLRGGLNTYAYVNSQPTRYADPLGLQAVPVVPVTPAPAPGGVTTPGGRSGGYDPRTDIFIPPSIPGGISPLAILCRVAPLACAAAIASQDAGKDCPDRPEVDWNDPSKPPVGPDGRPWTWRGPDAPGGKRGGYVNPNNPDQSMHPDLNHPDPIGPHWDFTDRNVGGWRVFPDGTVKPK